MGIFYDKTIGTFFLESKDVTYAFRVTRFGFLEHLYFGKRVAREDLSHVEALIGRGQENVLPDSEKRIHSLNQYLNECPTYGRSDNRESMLAVCDDRYSRISELKYVSHKILPAKPAIDGMPSSRGGKTLAVTLKDALNGSVVTLFYTAYDDVPVITRRMEIENKGKKPLVITRAYSACLDLCDDDWQALSLYGAWARERFIDRTPLHHGIWEIDSKRCSSSGQLNPFAALVRPHTTEENGEAIGVNLVYSGDFTVKAQVDQDETTRLLVGINDYDFEWTLGKNEKFSTPEAVFVYSADGLGGMSRAFHDFYRNYLINDRFVYAARPIVINNWEATYFNFDNEKLCAFIDSAKGTGINTFVLDDGWFGKRNNDKAGLGDWFINTDKLEGGLTTVINHAHESGLKFGLWFEPEMINVDSDLYREHPDWIVALPDLKPCAGRDQQILDLTRKEVREYVIKVVSDILKNNAIDYVKWDMNRTMTENFSQALGEKNKAMHHRYILGLYEICEALVNGFPHIFFEGCASGGCRFDPAMLYYFPQIWTSDDTDAYMRTLIQYGTSLCYPLSAMSCHVAACPNHQTGRNTPFASRADIAHLGATGYELDLTKFTEEELEEVKAQVNKYNEMSDLVLKGDLYRLASPFEGNYFAEQLVSKDGKFSRITVMRNLNLPNGIAFRVYPKGLDEKADYYVSSLGRALKGATIAGAGLVVNFDRGDFVTTTIDLTRK